MAQQQRRTEEQETYTNGVDRGIDMSSATKMVQRHPELQGYVLIAAGTLAIVAALGFFPILKWLIVAAGALMVLLGVGRSHLVEKTTEFFKSIRRK